MEKEATNRLASIGGPVERRYRPKRMFWKSFSFTEYCLPQHSSCKHGSAFSYVIFESFVKKAILVSMCVLNFESCALVRRHTKRESQTQEMSLAQRRLTAIALSDSLASRLNIVFDSVEIVVDDSPSPQVKVKATKAIISSETNHTVTGRELDASTDTIHMTDSFEKADEQTIKRREKPPEWVWLAGVAAIAVGMIVGFKRFK